MKDKQGIKGVLKERQQLVIVGRVDYVKAISQDSIGGWAQEYKIMQVAQRHITWYKWVQGLLTADSDGFRTREVEILNSQKDDEDWWASFHHEHGWCGQR